MQLVLSSANESFVFGRRDRFWLDGIFSCLRSTVLPRWCTDSNALLRAAARFCMNEPGISLLFNQCTLADSLCLRSHLSYLALTQMGGRPVFTGKEKTFRYSGPIMHLFFFLPYPWRRRVGFLPQSFHRSFEGLCFESRARSDPTLLGNSESSDPSYRLSSCNVRLNSSSEKTRSDYSVEKGCHKLALIATIPQLLSCAIECLVR
jgi:hypothetical protein